jgi:ATP-dependent protease ClpP protease subunit
MKIQNLGNVTELYLYDMICADDYGDGISARMVVEALQGINGDIGIRLNTPGGDVFEGLAIYNAFNRYDGGRKLVSVDGAALSIGSVIAMAGDDIEMAENSMMMIHNTAMYTFGDSNDLRAAADKLDTAKGQIVGIYAARTGMEADKISAMMDEETWMTAQQALDMGFCTSVLQNKGRMVAKFDPKTVKHVPDWALQLFNEWKNEQPEEQRESVPWSVELERYRHRLRVANG